MESPNRHIKTLECHPQQVASPRHYWKMPNAIRQTMNLDNSYARLASDFHVSVAPNAAPSPSLLAWNQELAAELGLEGFADDENELVAAASAISRTRGFSTAR